MHQWYKCPECDKDILYGTNPCPYCKGVLDWKQQRPVLCTPTIEPAQQQVVEPSTNLPIWKKSISRRVDFYVSLGFAMAFLILVAIVNAVNGITVPLGGAVVVALLPFVTCYAIFAVVRLALRIIRGNSPIQLPKQIKSLSKKRRVALISASLSILAVIGCFMVCINLSKSSKPPPPVAKPAPIRHDISKAEINRNSAYWNLAWQGKSGDLTNVARRINLQYLKTHTYIRNQTDCNDMAIDIWNMLWTQGIRSIIVAGNLDQDNYTFAQCNHAWLLIFHLERGASIPWRLPLEPTNGEIYFRDDIERNPQLDRYSKGYYYTKPSDLREDLGKNW